MMEEGHWSMCYSHWLIKKTAWPDRSEHRQAGKTEQNAGKKGSELDAIALLSKMDAR